MAKCLGFVIVLLIEVAFIIIVELIQMYVHDSITTSPEPIPIHEVNYRLPLNIKPIEYIIHLGPHLSESGDSEFTFDGECIIEIQALQKTNQIQLHISNLKVSSGRYYKKGSKKTDLPQATPNSFTDIVVYNLDEELQANVSYYLYFDYVGSINEGMSGFYRNKYTTANATHWLYGTQFEPIDARSVFPCFDEPEFKATFKLSMTYNRLYESVGPTAVWEQFSPIHHKKIYYRPTPILSTYLLTFTISDLHARHEGQIAVFARPEYFSQTEYSLECGKNLLAAFRSYFNTNLSTITENTIHLDADPTSELGESSLLYDKKESSLKKKQLVTNIIAFKVVHLWWGNLVTCKWWGYIWLIEGFASYFQYFGTDLVDSSFDMSSQFVVDVIQNVMHQDATSDARPMSNENVRTKAEINNMFNQISYLKAAAVIRMTKAILGEENFRKSLNEYLTTYAYKNTIPSDLFKIWNDYWPFLDRAFSQKYFDSFTTQEGYAVVTFNRTSIKYVEVSQKRFLLKDFDKANAKQIYTLPITYTKSSEKNFQDVSTRFYLQNKTATLYLRNNDSWIIGNIQAYGYYRVNYDNNSWYKIAQKLFSESREDIHVLNRAQIVDDLLSLARAGEIDYNVLFYVFQYLKNETSYLPFAAARRGLRHLMTRLGNESYIFVPFLREIVQNNYHNVGFNPTKNETSFEIKRRTSILDWACQNIIPECVDQAKVHFDEISKNRSVDVNIRYDVYCAVARDGNETNFKTLVNKYTAETVSSEKNLILDSLSCVKDSKLVDRVFQIIISNDLRLHAVDRTIVLYNLCNKNNENVVDLIDLIDEKIDQLAKATGGYHSVASVVLEIAEHFTTEAQLDKLKNFNTKHSKKFGSSISTLQKAVTVVEENLKWSSKNLKKIKSVLAEIAPVKS